MDDERLMRIEERLAYAEQAVNELSNVLHQQQAQLERLEALCLRLGERLAAQHEVAPGNPLDEKPPHY